MGQEGRKWVMDFTWDAIASGFEAILQDTVAQYNGK
jgi:hypothetical protein